MTVRNAKKALRIWLWLALIALAWGAVACGTGSKDGSIRPGETPDTVPPPMLEKRPDGLAREFLTYIREGKYAKAYTYLSVDGRLSISQASFINGLANALKVTSNKTAFANRGVVSERIVRDKAIVKVGDLRFTSSRQWTWEFEKTDSGWKIRSLDLPPVATYQPKAY